VIPSKRSVILALAFASITTSINAMAGPRQGVAGLFVEVRTSVARGRLLTHHGQPLASRQIHFENRVTGDSFLTKTRCDGSFSLALAPGAYDLRHENGPIIGPYIDIRDQDINLGTVSEPGSLAHLLESEIIAPALIQSPASITSNVVPGNQVAEPENKVAGEITDEANVMPLCRQQARTPLFPAALWRRRRRYHLL
jgi:hypothetical protein